MFSNSPEKWILIKGKCYILEQNKTSFYEAASLCTARGGKLFEPENKIINGLVINNHHIHPYLIENESVWIGIHAPENIQK